jgi:hypothetical protein
VAAAAPTNQIDLSEPASPPVREGPETPEPPSLIRDRNLSVTPAPAVPREKADDFYYSYRQSLSPHVGFILDHERIDANGSFPMIFGLAYMFPRRHSPQVEISFDLLTDSSGQFSAVLRRVFWEHERFRPYVKAGLTLAADADEQLATLSNWDNYMGRAGAGFEDFLNAPMSVRIEVDLVANTDHQMLAFTFGYSWGW